MNEETLKWLQRQAIDQDLAKNTRPCLTGWRAQAVQLIAKLRGTNESAVVQWLLTQVLPAELDVLRGVGTDAKCPCCHRSYSAPAALAVKPPAPPPSPRLSYAEDPVFPPSVPPEPAPQPKIKTHDEELQALISGGLKNFMD